MIKNCLEYQMMGIWKYILIRKMTEILQQGKSVLIKKYFILINKVTMQIPSDFQYIQLSSYYKTNKINVSPFRSLISFKFRQLWDKFLQYITFLFHFSIS